MLWDKKNNTKKLPDLPRPSILNNPPSFRDYPEMHEVREEIPGLPSFPDSPMKKGFSQTAIKEAITTSEVENQEPLPEYPNFPEDDHLDKYRLSEIEEWEPGMNSQITPPPVIPSRKLAENKPIFVKLEKFQEARESLEKIKTDLGEIEDLLRQIKEVKMKEDKELLSWQKEIDNVKARLTNLTADIFERADI